MLTAEEERRPVAHPVVASILASLAARGSELTYDEWIDAFDRTTDALRDFADEDERERLLILVTDYGARFGCLRE